ncbi:MAG: DUF2975 domain-containing protein [Oscillospiraceae bacterium]|nr:DUF2975 domain-containing protein [Oscillospiraceae bacterium]
MKQKHLSNWLKLILIGIALCGLVVYALVVPIYGRILQTSYPELSNRFWPWLLFIWASGIPCYIVLYYAWRIATNIGNDQSFTKQNASLLKKISFLASLDAVFFLIGNVVLLFLNMSHPGVVIASFVIVFVGVAVAVISAALSHLVNKAALLQEQSDWTI